ncbi:hypothetical protein HYFRA_00000646 [Hymenoscyphus fraxineus]|uniref:Uncharacterized protein n=1 Tax=Hymenoscyphus fraxineus TaxID=746836 RepID=A0A9N9L483_9HELO|nr:hypothetical protein HYFRA_00000646 [Hymenoscyphus fraxineus]
MVQALLNRIVFLILCTSKIAQSQYMGYNLSQSGDPDSAIYDTVGTPSNSSVLVPEPDVYLNASVHVGEISLTVTNITAKINLQAEVLSLLSFNAGVDASIDRVRLLIQDVNAHVILEARLSNLLLMITNVLDSIDLNPLITTLGQDVGEIVNTTVGGLAGSGSGSSGSGSSSSGSNPSTSTSAVSRRSYELEHNILYSVNDYSGNTHTNRILSQSGALVDQSLDNNGHVLGSVEVGNYLNDMRFNGYNKTVSRNGATTELEYVYEPFPGLSVVSAVFLDAGGEVVFTQVLSESSGGGGSTISNSD